MPLIGFARFELAAPCPTSRQASATNPRRHHASTESQHDYPGAYKNTPMGSEMHRYLTLCHF